MIHLLLSQNEKIYFDEVAKSGYDGTQVHNIKHNAKCDVYSASLLNVLYLGVISGTIYKTIIVPSRTFCVVCYHVLDFDC